MPKGKSRRSSAAAVGYGQPPKSTQFKPDRSLIQLKRLHNSLDGAAVSQQGDDDDDQFGRLPKPFKHGSSSRAERLFAHLAAIALPFSIMNDDVALSFLASCAARRIRAKLFRRFHRL